MEAKPDKVLVLPDLDDRQPQLYRSRRRRPAFSRHLFRSGLASSRPCQARANDGDIRLQSWREFVSP